VPKFPCWEGRRFWARQVEKLTAMYPVPNLLKNEIWILLPHNPYYTLSVVTTEYVHYVAIFSLECLLIALQHRNCIYIYIYIPSGGCVGLQNDHECIISPIRLYGPMRAGSLVPLYDRMAASIGLYRHTESSRTIHR
jgi:hypothetical protein